MPTNSAINYYQKQAIVDATCSVLQGKTLSVTQLGRVVANTNQTHSDIRKLLQSAKFWQSDFTEQRQNSAL